MTIKSRLDIIDSNENKKQLLKHNVEIIIVYSLFLTVAFTLNTLVMNIFRKISGTNEPSLLFQIIYLISLILLIVLFTYIFNIKFKI
jgi:hypothetical protein